MFLPVKLQISYVLQSISFVTKTVDWQIGFNDILWDYSSPCRKYHPKKGKLSES